MFRHGKTSMPFPSRPFCTSLPNPKSLSDRQVDFCVLPAPRSLVSSSTSCSCSHILCYLLSHCHLSSSKRTSFEVRSPHRSNKLWFISRLTEMFDWSSASFPQTVGILGRRSGFIRNTRSPRDDPYGNGSTAIISFRVPRTENLSSWSSILSYNFYHANHPPCAQHPKITMPAAVLLTLPKNSPATDQSALKR